MVFPAAALVAGSAAAMAAATIALAVTIPTGRVTVPDGTDLLSVARVVVEVVIRAVWALLERL
jgi:hypothetical protein